MTKQEFIDKYYSKEVTKWYKEFCDDLDAVIKNENNGPDLNFVAQIKQCKRPKYNLYPWKVTIKTNVGQWTYYFINRTNARQYVKLLKKYGINIFTYRMLEPVSAKANKLKAI